MGDLNFISMWSGKNQVNQTLPAVLHQQGSSNHLRCSAEVWFQRSRTSWLARWKLIYPLQLNCSIPSFIQGISVEIHGAARGRASWVSQQRLRSHTWVAVKLVLAYVSAGDLLPSGILCPSRVTAGMAPVGPAASLAGGLHEPTSTRGDVLWAHTKVWR